MTGVEIAAAIQACKAAFDTIRAMAEAVNKSENTAEAVQITMAMAELGARVTEMQSAILELWRENDDLRRQLQAETVLEDFKKRYRYEESVCWKCDHAGKHIDGPFWPNCVDEGKERRLNPGATKGTYLCVAHKTGFATADYDDRSPGEVRSRFGRDSWMT